MQQRNTSPYEMFRRLGLKHEPSQRFIPNETDFAAWRKETLPKVQATLGIRPQAVDPDPELLYEWEDRGVHKTRYRISVGEELATSIQVNRPAGHDGTPLPTLCCWHGHGPFGKEPVMGNAASKHQEAIAAMNYDYGHQMAEHGYVTYAIDWMGAGDHNDRKKPHFRACGDGRDWCNLYYLHATMLGTTPLALHLSQGQTATDFVSTLPCVDASRLGVMGLSGGGTMTLWSALCDERFKAAEIIGYSGHWALFGLRDINYCGMQIAPGLFALVDLPDLQGLLAPLPLLVNIGIQDSCFAAEEQLSCYRKVESIYQAAGASDKLELDLFNGEHAWGGNKSVAFFGRYL